MNNVVVKKIIFSVSFVFVLSTLIFSTSFVFAQTPPTPAQCQANPNLAGCSANPTPAQCQANPNLAGCSANPNPNPNSSAETPKAQLQNPLGSVVTIPQIVSKIIKLIMGLVGIISLVMFIYAGFLWLTAQGKPDAVKKGRDTMLWAVVGLVVIFSSYIILNYIFKILTF
ncbi:MAG TPA: pilin [bacterium]|nr:pilin [bacterium]